MNWFPSRQMPALQIERVDWKIRTAFGRQELVDLWHDLWWSGVAAGRVEGIVGTMLVVLALAMVTLIVVLALRRII